MGQHFVLTACGAITEFSQTRKAQRTFWSLVVMAITGYLNASGAKFRLDLTANESLSKRGRSLRCKLLINLASQTHP